jgi:peptidoglycan/xylan/chitin deacetylase (PgdA/CDA1 family)
MQNTVPLISFTFDDFPRSALKAGGEVLNRHGARGTYYASLGLMDQNSVVGPMFASEDLEEVIEQGHELGCHTFHHSHAWDSKPEFFEESIKRNAIALRRVLPGAKFKTLSYPIHCPRPRTKRVASHYFAACRCGGQWFNDGVADLNHLAGFFIEKSEGNISPIRAVIDKNAAARGWLILATHDVHSSPSPYGCTPKHFEEIVKYSVQSGAEIIPVGEACNVIRGFERVTAVAG